MNIDKTIQDVKRTMFTPSFLDSPPPGWTVEKHGTAEDDYAGTKVMLEKPSRTWVLTGERDSIGGGYEGVQE